MNITVLIIVIMTHLYFIWWRFVLGHLSCHPTVCRYVAPLCFEETMMSQPPSMSPEAEL